MRTISIQENLEDYKKLFEELVDTRASIVVWQIQDGERIIKVTKIQSFSLDSLEFITDASKGSDQSFLNDDIYFYAKGQSVIFKTTFITTKKTQKSYQLPIEIKSINRSEVPSWMSSIDFEDINVFVKGHGYANIQQETTRVRGEGRANINEETHMRYNSQNATDHISTKWRINSMSDHDSEIFNTELSTVSLDEEDKIYADQRAAPRARPPKDKMICIQLGERPIGEMFSLFDLSQGGLGFITTDKEKFQINQSLNVLGFDDKNFETPMVVIVRAIRDTDESGIIFKVGCSFQA